MEAVDNNRQIEKDLTELSDLGLHVEPATFARLQRFGEALEQMGDFFLVLHGFYKRHGARGPEDLTPEQSLELLQLIGGLNSRPAKIRRTNVSGRKRSRASCS